MSTIAIELQFPSEAGRRPVTVHLPAVPVPGEVIELDGTSYRVRERGWVVDTRSWMGPRVHVWVTLMPWSVA